MHQHYHHLRLERWDFLHRMAGFPSVMHTKAMTTFMATASISLQVVFPILLKSNVYVPWLVLGRKNVGTHGYQGA
jgi:hypothetical protein